MSVYKFPIIPFPEEKFCPIPNKDGDICNQPTVGEKQGIKVCKNHLSGRYPWPARTKREELLEKRLAEVERWTQDNPRQYQVELAVEEYVADLRKRRKLAIFCSR